MTDTHQSGARPVEVEELTNRLFIHPLSALLTPLLAKAGVTPNQVSYTGLVFGLLAAAFFSQWQSPAMVGLGFAAMVVWHVLDGTDGRLARLTGQVSEYGKLLDGVCDYLTFIVLYITIAASTDHHWAVMTVASVAAGASHVYQSFRYEREREIYMYLAYDRPLTPARPTDRLSSGLVVRIFGWLYDIYAANQARPETIDPRLRALCSTPAGKEFYKRHAAITIRNWGFLSANMHTIALAVICLITDPLWYFLFEIFVLNGLLLVLHARHRQSMDSIVIDHSQAVNH